MNGRFAIGLCAATILGCHSAQEPSAALHPASDSRVILEIIDQDERIVVTAGEDGPRYSLLTEDGLVLVPPMTESQLAKRHPELQERVRGLRADVFE